MNPASPTPTAQGPTPRAYDGVLALSDNDFTRIVDAKFSDTTVARTTNGMFDTRVNEQHAAYFVLAVNSHARLTAENERLRTKMEAINRRASAQPLRNWDQAIADLDACADIARSALTPQADTKAETT